MIGDQQQRRSQHRQRDVAQALQQRRAVDVRGFVEIARNALQRGEQDDHVVAEVLPDREQDDRRHRPVRIAEPVDRRDVEFRERVVDEAIARVEEIAPDHRDRDDRRHDRREQRGAEESLEARKLRIEQQRRAERQRDRQRHADQHEVQRVAERFPEQRRLQDVEVVAEPDEAQVAKIGERVEIEIGQAERERGEHRHDEERADDDERRRDERPCGAALVSWRGLARSHPAALFEDRVGARVEIGERLVGAVAAADRALGGEADFLRDALPFGHFRRRLDAFELIAERGRVRIVRRAPDRPSCCAAAAGRRTARGTGAAVPARTGIRSAARPRACAASLRTSRGCCRRRSRRRDRWVRAAAQSPSRPAIRRAGGGGIRRRSTDP